MTQHGVISVHSTDRNNPKNLDPSHKTDLDFLGDCLGKVKKSVSKPKKYGISAANRNSGTIYFPAEKISFCPVRKSSTERPQCMPFSSNQCSEIYFTFGPCQD